MELDRSRGCLKNTWYDGVTKDMKKVLAFSETMHGL